MDNETNKKPDKGKVLIATEVSKDLAEAVKKDACHNGRSVSGHVRYLLHQMFCKDQVIL